MLLVRAALVLALSLSAQGAAGDEATDAARQHYQRGQRAYSAGSYAEALAAFEQAYRYKPLPGFLFNLGQCHRKLGNYERALHYFQRYLREGAEGPNRKKAKRLVVVLKRKLRKDGRRAEPPAAGGADQQREAAPPAQPASTTAAAASGTSDAGTSSAPQPTPPQPPTSSAQPPAEAGAGASAGPPAAGPAQATPPPSATSPTAAAEPGPAPATGDSGHGGTPAQGEQEPESSQSWWIWAVAGGGLVAAALTSATVIWLALEASQPSRPEPSLGYWDMR